MNMDYFLNITPVPKDLPKPANDLTSQKAVARKAYETKKSPDSSPSKDTQTSGDTEEKRFEDYLRENRRSAETQEKPEVSAPEQDPELSGLRDLREAISKLLKELTGEETEGPETAEAQEDGEAQEKNPLEQLIAFLSNTLTQTEDRADSTSGIFTPVAQTPEEQLAFRNGLESLQELLAKPDLTDSLGLSAEELARLQEEIERALNEDRNFDELALLNEILARTVELVKPDKTIAAEVLSPQDFEHLKAARFEDRYALDASAPAAGEAVDNGYDFRATLRAAQAGQTPSGSPQHQAAPQTAQDPPAPLFLLPDDGAFITTTGSDGSLTVTGAVTNSSPAPLMNVSLTNPAAQAHGAAPAHPVVQTVAATIQKLGAEKQDTRITLQLDPPELGRVEVKMSMNKDNAAKVVLTIEKPETYHLLQRDAHRLERALQDSGLNPDGSGLEFSLAEDGYSFGRDGGSGGHGSHGSGGSLGETEDVVAIASPDGWAVDPETGQVRYNALI